MIQRRFILVILVAMLLSIVLSFNANAVNSTLRIIHVAKTGIDSNDGKEKTPLLTISKAETLAKPCDRVIVHKGTYREMIVLHAGGKSSTDRITYMAAAGEDVSIKGSEQIDSWVKEDGNTWRTEIDEGYFKGFNPFSERMNKEVSFAHLGSVYLNNMPLKEMGNLNEVAVKMDTWFTKQENGKTIIVANFGHLNPNQELAEINVRPAAFSALNSDVSYMVLDGFKMAQFASPMASLHGEQPGAIATNGGTYWLIQNCSLSDCKSVAISIGQTGHSYPNAGPGNPEFRDLSRNISEVGHHVIRHNHIFRCGQAGIYGLLHGTCSEISDNLIEDINGNNEFPTKETAGIRLALAVDVIVKHNLIRRVNGTSVGGYGLFLGPLFQGARISGNVISDTKNSCIYLYNNHGPALFDNNILSGPGKQTKEGVKMVGAEANVFVQNLFYDCGFSNIRIPGKTFATSNYLAHSLVIKQTIPALPFDDRWYSNLFIKGGLDQLSGEAGCEADYNACLEGASNCLWGDKHSQEVIGSAGFKLVNSVYGVGLKLNYRIIPKVYCPAITPSFIGFFTLSKQFIEYPDGRAITIDKDFLENTITESSRYPGPFYRYSGSQGFEQLFNYQK